jgi:simple sugar transport system permease protein
MKSEFAGRMATVGREAVRYAAAVVLALAVLWLTLRAAHGDFSAVVQALCAGAFGSRDDIATSLNKAVPLLLTGLGVGIAFRAKFWNVGGEGQFLVGALAAAAVGAYRLHNLPMPVLIPLVLLAGAIAGAAWGGLAGWLRVRRGVPEVISTIMLNFVAAQLLSYLIHGPMQEASKAQPATEAMPDNATLPIILSDTTLHAGLYVALAAAAVVVVMLARTRFGFAVRAVGANPDAARASGFDVDRVRISVMLWSGALCGLAGAVELSGTIGTIYENYAPGYGFTAIAVALLGRLNPYGIVASALFFGGLTAGCENAERAAGVSSALVYVIQAAILLVLLAFQSGPSLRRRAIKTANEKDRALSDPAT